MKKKTVLVVGGGGREHAVCWKLAQSPAVGKLYCAPGNAGISRLATCLPVSATDLEGLVQTAREVQADLTVVGPDDPLALGLVDRLQEAGFRAFGPTAAAAQIEASKSFAKDLMRKYGIPTAEYRVFTAADEARAHLERHFAGDNGPAVVKADGLALGKGVTVARSFDEAWEAAEGMLSGRAFGQAGRRVVIEEFLTGPEVSVLAFCDGRRAVPMVPAQDHKPVGDGDTGPNTGGMGTVSPVGICPPDLHRRIMDTVVQPTVEAMSREGRPFKGVLFTGLMLTPKGPKVLEFNARFGDPETQSVLRRLDSDLLEIFEAVIDGDLTRVAPRWSDKAAACVVMASGGYPGNYAKGLPIEDIDVAEELDGVVVFHAGTSRGEGGRLVTAGGRVLGVTATGADLRAALAQAYRAVGLIRFDGAYFRRDIGCRAL